jgi:UPF0716 protein FxsA
VPLLLFALFILLPIAELYVIIQVGGAIGVVPTLAILIADSLIGTWLLRHQGRAAWARFQAALNENRMPHREVFDGAMVILGGALLLTPGFITDVFGIVLLIPPTRDLVWAFTKRFALGRLHFGARAGAWGYNRMRNRGPEPGPQPGWPPPGNPAPGRRPGDIDGTAHELPDEPPPELPEERETPPS